MVLASCDGHFCCALAHRIARKELACAALDLEKSSGSEAQAVSPGGDLPDDLVVAIDRERAVQIMVDVFKAAAEREISIGGGINIWVVERPSSIHKKGERGHIPISRLPATRSYVSLPMMNYFTSLIG